MCVCVADRLNVSPPPVEARSGHGTRAPNILCCPWPVPCQRLLAAPFRPLVRPSLSRPFTMAPKKQEWQPVTSSLPWTAPTAARLDAYRAVHDEMVAEAAGAAPGKGGWSSRSGGTPAGRGGGAAEPTAAAPPNAPEEQSVPRAKAPAVSGVQPPARLPETPAQELMFLRFSQHAPLGFAPAHKAVMIAGRPVVVPPTKIVTELMTRVCVVSGGRLCGRAEGGVSSGCLGAHRNARSCEPTARGRAVPRRTGQ